MRKLLLTSIPFAILSIVLGFYAFRANRQVENLEDAHQARQEKEEAKLDHSHCTACCDKQEIGIAWGADHPSEFPVGDIDNGQQLYNVTYGCETCHGRLDDPASAEVGPWLGYLATDGAPSHRPNAEQYTAADYIFESIMEPSAYIAPKCPTGKCAGPPSGMPDNFGLRMQIQDMSDVIAYILGESTFTSTYPFTQTTAGYQP